MPGLGGRSESHCGPSLLSPRAGLTYFPRWVLDQLRCPFPDEGREAGRGLSWFRQGPTARRGGRVGQCSARHDVGGRIQPSAGVS